MKLRNKKTGEIVSLQGELTYDGKVRLLTHYGSLAELNEEWEDYEEPKEYWYIYGDGCLQFTHLTHTMQEEMKQIGNYFGTREEAEKAVKKLKAWKRLKDKGFSFIDWNWKTQCIDYNLDYTDITEEQIEEAEKELDLLFGGE